MAGALVEAMVEALAGATVTPLVAVAAVTVVAAGGGAAAGEARLGGGRGRGSSALRETDSCSLRRRASTW